MVKLALAAPAGTITDVGTTATPSLLEIRTAAPVAGAGPVNITRPSLGVPAFTVAGVSDNCESAAVCGVGAVGVLSPHATAQIEMTTSSTTGHNRRGAPISG
jgi:hypothetical protein